MKLPTLAGALALSVGIAALMPVSARADDRGRRDHDRGRDFGRSHRSERPRSFRSYRSFSYARPYRYRSYGYGYAYPYYDGGYYSGYYNGGYYDNYYDDYYAPYYRRGPRVVVVPSFRYYRPLLGVRIGGRHGGVWLGF